MPAPSAPILLVDDNPHNLVVLDAVLSGPGVELVRAASGEQALELLAGREFAVVLLDLHLPGLDGFETARRVRATARAPETPIIFVTAHDEAAFPVREAYALGAVDYLTKPLVPEVLRAKVGVFVELFRKAERIRELEREALLRTVGDNLPDGAIYQVVATPDGGRKFNSISAGVERVFGVTQAEATADASALYGLILPEDVPRVAAAEAAAQEGRAAFDCEFRSRTRSGDVRWVHCRSAPRTLPDGRVVWDGVILDVTDRKRAEEALRASEGRFRAVVEKSYDAVTLTARDGTVLYVTPSCLAISGYTPEEVVGRNVLGELVHPDDRPAVWAGFRGQLDRPGSTVTASYRLRHKDGSWRWVEVRRTNLLDDPAVGALVVNLRDVTAEREAVEALRDADRRKDEFIATLAHELRNPLAPIRTAAEIMRLGGGLPPDAARARSVIERQVAQLVRLVDDLLDVSRISRGKIELRRERVDLRDVARAAVETSQPLLAACRHDLDEEVPGEPVWVHGDPFRLTQVVGNLLNNAAKYTPPGGRVRLSVERNDDSAVVRVADTGVGIRAEDLPRVFELFAQVGGHGERLGQGGLGIGLALVKRLAEMHGGRVEAHSDGPGKGSEFAVRLPLAPS